MGRNSSKYYQSPSTLCVDGASFFNLTGFTSESYNVRKKANCDLWQKVFERLQGGNTMYTLTMGTAIGCVVMIKDNVAGRIGFRGT